MKVESKPSQCFIGKNWVVRPSMRRNFEKPPRPATSTARPETEPLLGKRRSSRESRRIEKVTIDEEVVPWNSSRSISDAAWKSSKPVTSRFANE